ncbi:MAG: DUF3526 domain-containing protein [Opitutaceae bacterium]|nr:DUF3526 domain-containing protein [Opitutaceae bacterium]
MSPFRSIARTEWQLLVRRRSYGVLLGAFSVVLAFATGLGVLRQDRELQQQRRYQALVREQWVGQPDRHPHRVAHYGTFAFKPVGPLAAFDPGVESFSGRVQFLEAHRQNAANFAEAGALSSAFRLGELSPAFVVHLLLPLVVIVLGYRILADDREAGRLRLLLAQGTPPGALLAGKAAGLALGLAPFATTAAIALAASVVLGPGAEGAAAWIRGGLVAAAAGLHLAGWLTLTLWASARAATPVRALGGLVTLWAAVGIVLPRTAGAIAATQPPLPGKSEFAAQLAAEVHRLGDAHNPGDPVFARLRRETLARHGVDRVEDLPVNYGAIVMARGEELTAEAFARHFSAVTEQMERQEAVVHRAAWFAPYLAVRALSAAASGTDLRALTAFQRAAEAYRFSFVQALNALHRDKIRFTNDRAQRLAASHWAAFPDFHVRGPALTESLAGTAGCWAALAAWLLAPLVGLWRTGVRP